jgi:ABC-type transporter Mla MlaB component
VTAPATHTVAFVVGGLVAPTDVPGLCERLRALLESSEADCVLCDVGALITPDAATVDALARLQVTAQRLGRDVRIRHASDGLVELLALVGLADVIRLCAESGLQAGGQAEEREEGGGIEE